MTKVLSTYNKDFRGGIQAGTTAYDTDSKRLDEMLKNTKSMTIEGYTCKSSITGNGIFGKDGCVGMSPDGGMWFDKDDQLVLVAEAKKQGPVGNACERWFKNRAVAQHINPDVMYVTFCSGTGTLPKSTMYRTFNVALAIDEAVFKDTRVWNELYTKGSSFFGHEEGFTQEYVNSIIEKALKQ